MQMWEFCKEFLPLQDTGSSVNFVDNSRSCWQILMRFLRVDISLEANFGPNPDRDLNPGISFTFAGCGTVL